MADVPVPGPQLTEPLTVAPPDLATAAARVAAAVPVSVRELVEVLRGHGHAAYVVGGSVRDVLLGRPAADWDLATDALPERVVELLPDAAYENRFGTVGVRRPDGVHEITTFRTDHEYADFRRPHRVEFGDSILLDLARRDFTVNAMAWGGPGRAAATPGEAGLDLELVDPHGGLADTVARRLRAVGDPVARFEEDALRMIRAVRLAATLGFTIEPTTLAAIGARAELARFLSGERLAIELGKLLAAERPSAGLRVMAESGLLEVVLPELAAQRGVPQNKVPGEDLWDHTLRTTDAAPVDRPVVRLAALLHDIGKPPTQADGHFYGHDAIGARMADALLRRLHEPRAASDRVVKLIRNHMFTYDGGWGDGAVRRLIAKIGRDALEELFLLREADDVGSGLAPGDSGLDELRRRVAEQLAADVALDRAALAVDGFDLIRELGLEPGPVLGRILDELLDRVIADPTLNDRPTLLLLAQASIEDEV
jgi:tRNA nucleotidyltransferase (CCA-adding enzyme)